MFPRAYAAVLCGVLAWIAAVVVLAVAAPLGLYVLLALGLAAAAAAALRARTGWTRPHGLPPGSLSLATSVSALANRRFYLEQAEEHGPIFKVAQFHRNVVCVVGLEPGHRLLREHAASLAPSPLPFTREVAGGFLRYMDPETYSTYGPLFRRALTQPVVDAATPVAADSAARELARLAADGSRAPRAYFDRIVTDALARALLGLVPGTADATRFESAYRILGDQNLAAPFGERTSDALVTLRRLVAELADDERAPVSALTELRRIDPAMPDAVCVDNLLFTLKIATENVVDLMHWVVAMLGRHPHWAERVRSGDDPDLVDRITMETLRLAQSEYLYRVVAREFEFEGLRFPKGWLIRVCVWESHRSAEAFEEPETFDPDRFLARSPRRDEYSPFGRAQHACNGVPLAYMVCRSVIEALAGGFDWEVGGDGPPEREFRHWSHWRPSSGLRLDLTVLEPAPAVAATAS